MRNYSSWKIILLCEYWKDVNARACIKQRNVKMKLKVIFSTGELRDMSRTQFLSLFFFYVVIKFPLRKKISSLKPRSISHIFFLLTTLARTNYFSC